MSAPLNQRDRSITRMRSTLTARRATSRFMVRGRVPSSSFNELRESTQFGVPPSGGRLKAELQAKDKCHEKQHEKPVAHGSGSIASVLFGQWNSRGADQRPGEDAN